MKTDKTMIILAVIVVVAIAVSVGCYYFYDQDNDQTDKATPVELIQGFTDGQQMEFVDQTSPDITKTIVVFKTDDEEWMIQTYGGVEVENDTTLTYEATDIWNSDWASSFSHEGNETMNTMNGTKDVSVWKSNDKTLYIGSDNILYAYQESGTLYSLYINNVEDVGQYNTAKIVMKYNAFIKVKFDNERPFISGKSFDVSKYSHYIEVSTMFGLTGTVTFVMNLAEFGGDTVVTLKETKTVGSDYSCRFNFDLRDYVQYIKTGSITVTFTMD